MLVSTVQLKSDEQAVISEDRVLIYAPKFKEGDYVRYLKSNLVFKVCYSRYSNNIFIYTLDRMFLASEKDLTPYVPQKGDFITIENSIYFINDPLIYGNSNAHIYALTTNNIITSFNYEEIREKLTPANLDERKGFITYMREYNNLEYSQDTLSFTSIAPSYKKGDFVVFSVPDKKAYCIQIYGVKARYLSKIGINYYERDLTYYVKEGYSNHSLATEDQKKLILDALNKDNKYYNPGTFEIEDLYSNHIMAEDGTNDLFLPLDNPSFILYYLEDLKTAAHVSINPDDVHPTKYRLVKNAPIVLGDIITFRTSKNLDKHEFNIVNSYENNTFSISYSIDNKIYTIDNITRNTYYKIVPI